MLDTYLSKLDNCLDENMSMLSSRNIELLEKILDVRHKMCKAYDDNYEAKYDIINDDDKNDTNSILISHLLAYEDDKKLNKETSINHLVCFMDELIKEFKKISTLSSDCDKEMLLVRKKLKEDIYTLFA